MGEHMRVLVDTNVWLDYFLASRKGSAKAVELLALAREREVELLFGTSKLETVFYQIGRDFKALIRRETGRLVEGDALAAQAYAWGCVESILELATAVGMDGSDLWVASKYRSICADFEDNVLLAAAQRADVDYLVTSDQALLKVAGAAVRAVTPETMTIILREGL